MQTTKENIGKAKDRIADFKTKRAMKAAEQKKAQAAAERNGSQIRQLLPTILSQMGKAS